MPSINNDLLKLIEIVEELNNIDDDYLKEYYI
jgi:hypothetical protein